MSPEERAQQLANEILDRGMVPIISTECRALIAAAIRQAENAAYERARIVASDMIPEAFPASELARGISNTACVISIEIERLKSTTKE